MEFNEIRVRKELLEKTIEKEIAQFEMDTELEVAKLSCYRFKDSWPVRNTYVKVLVTVEI